MLIFYIRLRGICTKNLCHDTEHCADPTVSISTLTEAEGWTVRQHPPSYSAAVVSEVARGERMHFLHQILDTFGPESLVLGRYQLLGKHERRTGGVGLYMLLKLTV
jgi:hypothetical protein